ncbi:MAG: hypothetical protein HY362_03000 [Candidatus Aenigmarchaeota archaeon]|nr:hypothetical protein [Candidatus Aenigmarchaeota archaeon]
MSAKISDEQIEADILHKLYRKRKWGASHTDFTHLYKGVPPEYVREYKQMAEKLIREGVILRKITSYGLHVSLNPNMSKYIKVRIRKFFENII